MEIQLKQKLFEIFGSQLKFNKDFDKYANLLKEGMIRDLIDWCIRCKEKEEEGSQPKNDKLKHLFVFFRKIGSNVRVTLVKIKNADFIEIYLTDHSGYDDLRLEYGYKKSSYYGS
jgi:hypothetical protein